jgi:putative inorganic carbon (HCO3(-)) transporter
LLTGITLFYAVINWSTTKRRIEWLLIGVIAVGIALSLLAFVMVKWEINKVSFIPSWIYQRFTILVSDPVNPNVLAGSLVILLPFAITMLKLFLFGGTVIMMVLLVLTQSRGGWMAFGVMLVVLSIFRWRFGWVALIFGFGVSILLIQLLGTKTLLELLLASNTLGGIDGRIEVWSRALLIINDFAWTGIGIGLFGDIADSMYPFIHFLPGMIFHAHNLFLQIAVDLGIPGVIIWISIEILVFFAGWKLYQSGRLSQDKWVIGLGVAVLCSQVTLIVHGLIDAPNWGMIRTVPIIWAVWGLVMASLYVFNGNNIENA